MSYKYFLFFSVLTTVGCTVSPDAGHEAVLVMKPLFFGHGGVDETPIKTGLTYVAPTTESVIVDMRPVQVHIKFDDLMSADGVPLDFDTAVLLKVKDSVALVKRFGDFSGLYKNNVDRPIQSFVRESVKAYGMNETAINTVALQKIDDEVTQKTKRLIVDNNYPIELISFTMGKANPPDSVKNQRIETAAQEQRIQTEKQKKLAEDSRMLAEQSRANADKAYRENMGFNKEEYLQLEMIKHCGNNCTFILGVDNPVVLGKGK